MVAIDVNSGRATQGRGMEDTAYQTNLEAAEEIARQLRLRDLGGLVVIDFIDMWDRKHNQEIERSLRNALKRDKARVEVGRISRFGMLELSRQRIRPAVAGRSFIACGNCGGSGLVKSTEAAALTVLRRIQAGLAKGGCVQVKVELPDEVATYLLNQKRAELFRLEKQYGLKIQISGQPGLPSHQFNLEFVRKDASRGDAAENPEGRRESGRSRPPGHRRAQGRNQRKLHQEVPLAPCHPAGDHEILGSSPGLPRRPKSRKNRPAGASGVPPGRSGHE